MELERQIERIQEKLDAIEQDMNDYRQHFLEKMTEFEKKADSLQESILTLTKLKDEFSQKLDEALAEEV